MSKPLRLTGRFLVAGAALAVLAPAAFAFTPDDPYFFYNKKLPSLPGQWHLINTAPISSQNAGLDMNIKGAWESGITGQGVVIGIIDDGVDGSHEDLAANYRADLSKNFSSNAAIAGAPQGPQTIYDMHGQSVAGVAAARGANGIGVSGAAPYAQIAGQRISFGDDGYPMTTANTVDAFLWKSGVTLNGTVGRYVSDAEIHVSNNSWGPTTPFQAAKTSPVQALKAASLNNTIFLFAAANSRGSINEQTAAQERNGAETVITIGAVNATGKYSSYSNWGACLFASALSNEIDGSTNFGITTTDRAGGYGYNTSSGSTDGDRLPNLNYTSTFGGTSSATPLATGIIALGKQIAPAMDTRMAKHILARTSRVIDANDNTTASAGRWVTNGAGLNFNPDYGFGLIDASAFVSMVRDTAYVTDRTTAIASVTVNKSINTAGGITQAFTFTGKSATAGTMQKVESVEVTLSATGTAFYTGLQLSVLSPSGTTSYLYRYDDSAASAGMTALTDQLTTPGTLDWTFVSNAFWGENSIGTWQVNTSGRGTDKILKTLTLTLNMGDIAMEQGTLAVTAGTNIKAHSVNFDYGTSVLDIRENGRFTVTDSVNLYAGRVNVAGTLDEGDPYTAAGWGKNSKISVYSGARLDVEATGKVVASRGIDLLGSTMTVADGGSVTTAGGTLALTRGATLLAKGSLDTSGALSVTGTSTASFGKDARFTSVTLADAGSLIDVKQKLTASSSLTMTGGELRVGGDIETPKFTMSGGLFAPGGSGVIGSTRISGALELSGSAVLVADIRSSASNGGHDLVTVGSGSKIDGGTLIVNTLEGGVIKNGDTIKIIDGGITGTFGSLVVTGERPLLQFKQNAADAGSLDAKVSYSEGCDRIGASRNMRVVAGLIDTRIDNSLSHANDFVTAGENATNAADASALLSAFVPDNGLALSNNGRVVANAVTDIYTAHASRMRSGSINPSSFWANPLFESYSFEYSGKAPLLAAAGDDYLPLFGYDDTSVSVWLNGNASSRSTKATPSLNLTKSDTTSLGAAVGADYRLTNRYESDIRAGGFVSAQSGQTDLGDNGAKSTTDSTAVAPGLYVSGQAEGFVFDAMTSFAVLDYTLERDVPAFGSVGASKAKADTSGTQVMARAGVSRHWYCNNGIFFGPDLSMTYVRGDIDGYTEKNDGGIAGLTVGKQSFDSLVSSFGMTVGKQCNLDAVSLLPMLNLAWEHEFLDRTSNVGVTSNSLNGFNYTAATPELGADSVLLGASVQVLVTENSQLTVGYQGRFLREGVNADHRFTATVSINF